VAEIKERAIQQAQRASRGSSAISLIRSAKSHITLAKSCESAGDLKFAFSAFTRAASLIQAFVDTEDFKAERFPGKRGVLWKEYTEFQQREGSDLLQRALDIEIRLTQKSSQPLCESTISTTDHQHEDLNVGLVIDISSDEEEEPRPASNRTSRKPRRAKPEEILEILEEIPAKHEHLETESLQRRCHELEQERDRLQRDYKCLAEPMDQLKLSVSALDEVLCCDVCTQTMWSPYLLAHCGHTFCQGCLTNWFNTTRRQRNETGARGMPAYSCPSCRHPVRSHPVQNFSLKRLAAESRGESTAQRPPPVQPPLRKRGGGGPFNVFFGLAPP